MEISDNVGKAPYGEGTPHVRRGFGMILVSYEDCSCTSLLMRGMANENLSIVEL